MMPFFESGTDKRKVSLFRITSRRVTMPSTIAMPAPMSENALEYPERDITEKSPIPTKRWKRNIAATYEPPTSRIRCRFPAAAREIRRKIRMAKAQGLILSTSADRITTGIVNDVVPGGQSAAGGRGWTDRTIAGSQPFFLGDDIFFQVIPDVGIPDQGAVPDDKERDAGIPDPVLAGNC